MGSGKYLYAKETELEETDLKGIQTNYRVRRALK